MSRRRVQRYIKAATTENFANFPKYGIDNHSGKLFGREGFHYKTNTL
jgi:hypothetical protein